MLSKGESKTESKKGAVTPQAEPNKSGKQAIDLEMSSRGLALMLMDKMSQSWTGK